VLSDQTLLTEEEGDRDSAWRAPDGIEGSGLHALWLVSRDGRGGVSWARFGLQVGEE